MADTVTVPVKSAWASKINWVQGGAALTALITAFGIDIPADKKDTVLTGVVIAQGVVTWVLRTWFTESVTKTVAEKK